MKWKKLGELVTPAGRRAGTDVDHVVFSVTKHAGFVPSLDYFKKQVFGRDLAAYRLARRGDIAYATIHLDEGAIGVAPADGLISPMYTVFRPDGRLVDTNYLVRFLKSPCVMREYEHMGRGAVHRRKSIPLSVLSDLRVPLPSLGDQQRIAAILDAADTARTRRRQSLSHLDQVSDALFHSTFTGGTWASARLDDLSIISGEYGAGVASVEEDSSLPRYIRITDITDSGNLNRVARSPGGDEKDWARYALEDGDLLFARSGATVGKVFRYRTTHGPSVFAGYLIRFRPDPAKVHPDYIFGFTRTQAYRSWVAARQNVVAQPNINAQQYGRELPIPLPPLELQREFAAKVDVINTKRAAVERALELDEELFASLQSRAFTGEL